LLTEHITPLLARQISTSAWMCVCVRALICKSIQDSSS